MEGSIQSLNLFPSSNSLRRHQQATQVPLIATQLVALRKA